MTPTADDELRSRFSKLRESDSDRAPSYRAVLDRASHKSRGGVRVARRPLLRLALTLAAAAAIVLAVGVARVSLRRDFVPPPLSTWTSPTASLLRTPGSDLLTSPTLLSSTSTLRAGTYR
jgi:hypothetical protein